MMTGNFHDKTPLFCITTTNNGFSPLHSLHFKNILGGTLSIFYNEDDINTYLNNFINIKCKQNFYYL